MRSFGFQISDFRLVATVALALALASCRKKNDPALATPAPASSESATPKLAMPAMKGAAKIKVSAVPPPAEIWKEFSGEKAFAEVQKQVEIGPRPAGSAELEQARVSFKRQLATAAQGPRAATLKAEERLRAAYDEMDRLRRAATRAARAESDAPDGFAETRPMPETS